MLSFASQSSSIEPNVSVQATSLNQQEGDTNGFIDLVYKGVPGGMKYEFIVHPGARPDNIRLAYTGIEGLSIDDKGNLIIHTALGDVKDDSPYTYQEIDGKEVEVECRFVIARSGSDEAIPYNSKDEIASPSARNDKSGTVSNQQFIYGFEVSSYNKDFPLVIDPGLSYSTFLGGSGDNSDDEGNGIAVDASGKAYVTGGTRSSNFPTTTGAFDTSHNGLADVFVTKLNPAGTALVYSTFPRGE